MSTLITLPDGRSWWAANWAYDAVIRRIADQLERLPYEGELASWLRRQTCEEMGPGIGYVDVRELTPRNQLLFRQAAQQAFRHAILEGAVGWHDPSFFAGWLQGFRRLLRMWKAVDRGEPPGMLGDSPERLEPSGLRSGPGWEGRNAFYEPSEVKPLD